MTRGEWLAYRSFLADAKMQHSPATYDFLILIPCRCLLLFRFASRGAATGNQHDSRSGVLMDRIESISRRSFLGVTTAAAATLVSWPAEADSPGVDSGSIFKIHPAIGIARMGNAPPDSFFIGPEVPGFGPASLGTPPTYKSNGQVKPQAARFRIWEYRRDRLPRTASDGRRGAPHRDCRDSTRHRSGRVVIRPTWRRL